MIQEAYKQYTFVYSSFTLAQKLKLNLLVFFLIIFPFIKVFTDYYYVIIVDNPLLPWSLFNFFSVALCGVILILHQKKYAYGLIITVSSVLVLMLINFFFAEMASPKWMINWMGFLLLFVTVVQMVKTLTDAEIYMLQIKFTVAAVIIIGLFTLLTLYALLIEPWYLEPRLFNYYVFEDRNQIHRLYRDLIGTNKQHFGIFAVMLISLTVTHWKVLPKGVRVLLIFFYSVNLIAIVGVRTAILGSMVGVMAFYFLKNNFRKMIALLLALSVILLVIQYWTEVMLVVEIAYDRLPALQFAIHMMTQNFFGLGNGAYTIYVEANNDQLLSQFGSELMERHGLFWKAPESDLVYFIASWGVKSIFFFGFLGYLVVHAVRLFHRHGSLYPLEKHILVFTVLLIFMGISEDNAGELTWWIFISALFGVILRRKDEVEKDAGQLHLTEP